MDPITMAGLGLNGISMISSLLGAASARKRAEEERANIIADAMRQTAQNEYDTQYQGQKALAGLSGTLASGLESQARSLGDANAGAGVYNSSSVAGANAIQAGNNSSALANAFSDLASRLQYLKSSDNRYITGLRMGANADALNTAAGQQQMGYTGANNILQQLPGMINPPKPNIINGVQSGVQSAQQRNATLTGQVDPAQTMFPPGAGGTGLIISQQPDMPFFPTPWLARPRGFYPSP